MNGLTDTHCHLNLNMYDNDLDQVLGRAWARGLERILVPGIDVETSRSALRLAEQHPRIYAAVGVHPSSAGQWNEDSLNTLRELARHPKAAAIGEIGLDYYRDRAPRPVQRAVFQAQLELAAELGLPLVIHNREALEDVWAALSGWQAELARRGLPLANRPGVLHSYDGPAAPARQAAEHGFFIGVSGPVTFKNAPDRHQLVASLPLEQLLIETDAPYLTPHPYRGRRNEPAYVAFVAEKIAELHQVTVEKVSQATWDNAAQLFNWGADH